MKAVAETQPRLTSTDLAGWRDAVAQGQLSKHRPEDIVAALLDLGPNTDRVVRNTLAKHLSDEIYRRLRYQVGYHHPNKGTDIIDLVHFKLFEALARPHSKDAVGMRIAFGSRVKFRLKDALVTSARERRLPDKEAANENKKAKKKHEIKEINETKESEKDTDEVDLVGMDQHPDLIDEEVVDDPEVVSGSGIQRDPTLMDGVRDIDENIDINRFLEQNIQDERKRLAFRLHMERIPYKSKRGHSIAKALGVDEKTVRLWIEEVQGQLKTRPGEES